MKKSSGVILCSQQLEDSKSSSGPFHSPQDSSRRARWVRCFILQPWLDADILTLNRGLTLGKLLSLSELQFGHY